MLPILSSPKYDLKLPSSGKSIEYRPFLVSEEKLLLLAQESNESAAMLRAMCDVVSACTFGKVDPQSLTSYDLEFLFLKLRASSVGETSTVSIKCSECETLTPLDIPINEIDVKKDSEIDSNLMLNESVGITMRHVRVKDLAGLTQEGKSNADLITDTIIASIESIFDASAVHPTDEAKREELVAFVNSLNRAQMQKIQDYIAATPKVEYKTTFCCSGCKHSNEVVLSGIQSFFV